MLELVARSGQLVSVAPMNCVYFLGTYCVPGTVLQLSKDTMDKMRCVLCAVTSGSVDCGGI